MGVDGGVDSYFFSFLMAELLKFRYFKDKRISNTCITYHFLAYTSSTQ